MSWDFDRNLWNGKSVGNNKCEDVFMYCGRKMICSQIAIHFKHNLLFVISTATDRCLPAAYSFFLILSFIWCKCEKLTDKLALPSLFSAGLCNSAPTFLRIAYLILEVRQQYLQLQANPLRLSANVICHRFGPFTHCQFISKKNESIKQEIRSRKFRHRFDTVQIGSFRLREYSLVLWLQLNHDTQCAEYKDWKTCNWVKHIHHLMQKLLDFIGHVIFLHFCILEFLCQVICCIAEFLYQLHFRVHSEHQYFKRISMFQLSLARGFCC